MCGESEVALRANKVRKKGVSIGLLPETYDRLYDIALQSGLPAGDLFSIALVAGVNAIAPLARGEVIGLDLESVRELQRVISAL